MKTVLEIIFRSICVLLGLLNLIRGNDPLLGYSLCLISFLYYPFSERRMTRYTGIKLHPVVKILLALVIIWVSFAVGALAEGYYPDLSL
ncbi:MAG: hypothetical protein HRT61_18705 [Ekhidna sp.]|nr:hypothetical protein [Ekhidna sp.]